MINNNILNELIRWNLHQEYLQDRQQQIHTKSLLPISIYWREIGAYVSILPRKYGKTTFLKELAKNFQSQNEKFIVIVFNEMTKEYWPKEYKILTNPESKNLQDFRYEDIHLLVDDFLFITHLELFKYPWKSITMVSSLK